MSTSDRINGLISENDIMVFMKGTPAMPRCGFSGAVVQILNTLGVPYATLDVLEDPFVREGIKEFTNWPTIPQVFVKGEFIGGCDIVREMAQKGELQALFSEKGIAPRAA
ncbi:MULTISPECIES: Grx4 family monothiol glutaredoxin [Azorhizobium]|uniref:Glutaredoxin n=1 Tax=Azorhizobium caulinodans (strain ATCC 43989 / DSM 5975 / JCM 20966 / LMG 6465 / NBRC 14845 / NCIMB 13405 / ORS 571) TaxID=438753 RepID=A8IIQ9_AZOC5|nr:MULTISPECIES: Grx4 family monothiol glutaredoxin [Azorhizobium]TDU01234.1 monothiol glutaredoxin [Azorhizobium sp. AG788]BAF89436.1 glutaredoxin-related protein [Azorhizobium caulinodans ORS 571]